MAVNLTEMSAVPQILPSGRMHFIYCAIPPKVNSSFTSWNPYPLTNSVLYPSKEEEYFFKCATVSKIFKVQKKQNRKN